MQPPADAPDLSGTDRLVPTDLLPPTPQDSALPVAVPPVAAPPVAALPVAVPPVAVPPVAVPPVAVPSVPAPSVAAPLVPAPREEQPAASAAEPVALTEREEQILGFERKWWKHAGSKEQAVRDTFGLSATRYYQLLNGLLDNPAAMERDPVLVARLRRLRSTRARTRRR